MKTKIRILACLVFFLLAATAQDAAPAGFELWTAGSLKGQLPSLKQEAAGAPHHFAVHQLADFPNEAFMLVHRSADGVPEWHETQADVYFAESGTATLVVGGRLINADTVAPHEKRNGTIEGGARRKLSAGDIVRIPPRVPHQLLVGRGHDFNYFVVKVKGY